jgi:hypothetical protein
MMTEADGLKAARHGAPEPDGGGPALEPAQIT